jgi:hypothetical protein
MSGNPGQRREWGDPSSPVEDRTWAQAILAVVERRLTLRQAALAYGLQQAALHRLVRQHTLQQMRQAPAARPNGGASADSRFTPAGSAGQDRYVFPSLNPQALGHGSPNRGPLPPVAPLAAAMTSPPPVCELTPELNEEVVTVLREQFLQQQFDDYDTQGGRYKRLEGYADADIADVARAIVGANGRRSVPSDFPSESWLAMFKRENNFVDVDEMVRCRSRTSGGSLKAPMPAQRIQQERYSRDYELELQQYELEEQQRRGDVRWMKNRNYRQPSAPPPTSPMQRSPMPRQASYAWEDVDATDSADSSVPQQRLRFYEPQEPPRRQPRDDAKFRRSPSAGSSNGRSGQSDGERHYRQSNLVPAKVWEAAMEDVAIHGMSLRNAAKAHGVHFAALHRRLKKRQQHKLNMPCEPNYIPFEDEAGVVRVIHARAEMGVLLTFTELMDLLKRTALKHRSELPETIATALVRRFQSRVEQSVRHLIMDWPSSSSSTNVLYRLRDTSAGDAAKDGKTAGVPAVVAAKITAPAIISVGSGGSLSSSGSSSSLSPHPQAAAPFPAMHKTRVGPTPAPTWGDKNNGGNNSSSNNNNNAEGRISAAATVSPTDGNEMASNQPCMILRL